MDRTRLILLDAVRNLEPAGPGKFRPSTAWGLTVRIRPYIGQVRRRAGTVPVDSVPGTTATSEGLDDREPPDVIDILPAPVRKQVITTVPEPDFEDEYLFQGVLKGLPRDHEAGLVRATSQAMIAVLAKRSILLAKHWTAEDAEVELAGREWEMLTLTAQLGDEQMIDLVSTHGGAPSLRQPGTLSIAAGDREHLQ